MKININKKFRISKNNQLRLSNKERMLMIKSHRHKRFSEKIMSNISVSNKNYDNFNRNYLLERKD